MKTLEELKQLDCKWPCAEIGHHEHLFCGEPATKNSYCEHHAALAYRRLPPLGKVKFSRA